MKWFMYLEAVWVNGENGKPKNKKRLDVIWEFQKKHYLRIIK